MLTGYLNIIMVIIYTTWITQLRDGNNVDWFADTVTRDFADGVFVMV